MDKTTLLILSAVNRPGIVFMREQSELQKIALVVQINKFTVRLISSGESMEMDRQTFLDKWTGSYLYLWRSPNSFEILKPGDSNKPALAWLQEKLSIVNNQADKLITGGNYTEALQAQITDFQTQQRITADGIVGRQTLMRLNTLTESMVPTLTGSGG